MKRTVQKFIAHYGQYSGKIRMAKCNYHGVVPIRHSKAIALAKFYNTIVDSLSIPNTYGFYTDKKGQRDSQSFKKSPHVFD